MKKPLVDELFAKLKLKVQTDIMLPKEKLDVCRKPESWRTYGNTLLFCPVMQSIEN